jgi:hypothetical protein
MKFIVEPLFGDAITRVEFLKAIWVPFPDIFLNRLNKARIDTLRVVLMDTWYFCNMAPCVLVGCYLRFRGTANTWHEDAQDYYVQGKAVLGVFSAE